MRRKEPSRLYYISLFVVFGLATAIVTAAVFYRLMTLSEERNISLRADEVMAAKIDDVADYIEDLENTVVSLRDSALLDRYLRAPTSENLKDVQSLFYAITQSNTALMQARYIDESGMERVRVDYLFGKIHPTVVRDEDLQSKAHRYYFKEALASTPRSFWFSHLDLNIEHGKIDKPIRPVLRVASPIFLDGEPKGIVIINIHTRHFLEKLVHNHLFSICLADGEGNYLVATDARRSWSRYLKSGFNLRSDEPVEGVELYHRLDGLNTVHVGKLFATDLSRYLSKDKAVMVFRVREVSKKLHEEEKQKAVLLIVVIVVFLSFPLSWVISRGPVRLYAELFRKNRKMREALGLINEHIASYSVNRDGQVIRASRKFMTLTGLKSFELREKREEDLICGENAGNTLDELHAYIQSEEEWRGEMEYVAMDGKSCVWGEVIATVLINKDGKPDGYSVICHDISDKKRVEYLSITDGLTGLYNRRHFDTVMGAELSRARREGRRLGFAMLDVDHFKEYNDHYGHQKGDFVLIEIAGMISKKLRRPTDSCFRLGGEEFGILFLDMNQEEAVQFMDTVRKAVLELEIEHQWSGVAKVVSVSLGLLSLIPGDGMDADRAYRMADDALYRAKASGRNRVEVEFLC